jgi:rod shape-determining protein MreC
LRLAVPFKGMVQRFALLSLVLAAFGLMMLGKAETVLVERMRTGVTDVVAPVLDALSRPVATMAEIVDNFRELTRLRPENARLRARIERLNAWHGVALRLEADNRTLRALLNFTPEERVTFISARVIADGGGPFVRSVIVNAGARDGLRKGQAVVTGAGLAGRVSETGGRSARVLLLTDLNSRIPVVAESSRTRAILAGDNSARPRLVFLPENAKLVPGERIVTSGHGGALPAGLLVGIVTSAGEGTMRVEPIVDWDRLEYVRVIDFESVTLKPAPSGAKRRRGGS